MRYTPVSIISGFIALLLLGCQQTTPAADKHHYLYQDSMNVLMLGDSAYIHISYPQGTAFHQYQLTDSAALTMVTSHQKNEGNAGNSGGSMGETFYLRTVKTGQTVLRLTDVSAAALVAVKDSTSKYRNYRNYPIVITTAAQKK